VTVSVKSFFSCPNIWRQEEESITQSEFKKKFYSIDRQFVIPKLKINFCLFNSYDALAANMTH